MRYPPTHLRLVRRIARLYAMEFGTLSLASGLVVVPSSVATAQHLPDANAPLEQGVERRRAGDDAGALELFTCAWTAGRAPRARAGMALVVQALGHFVDAVANMLEALAATEDEWIVSGRADLKIALETGLRREGFHLHDDLHHER